MFVTRMTTKPIRNEEYSSAVLNEILEEIATNDNDGTRFTEEGENSEPNYPKMKSLIVQSSKRKIVDDYGKNKKVKTKGLDDIVRDLLASNLHNQESTRPINHLEIISTDIDFDEDPQTIMIGFQNWKERKALISQFESNLEMIKWKHFLNLNHAYEALNKLVNQNLAEEHPKKSIKFKIENFIPLGGSANKKSKRSWISYQIRTLLLIDKRTERRLWTALRFVNYLMSDGTVTLDSLVKAKILPSFFKKMNCNIRNSFLRKLKGNENLNFSLDDDKSDGDVESEEDGGEDDDSEV
ncbi:hypothetical protein C2G38_2140515 [Gigaspora rosea]|uniref:Uncharacterized protein n=1 Tax=Gigaspora rosea TaxID=44941 RepID=A0A397VIX9_9GLOM|nr:hypothetical protein C2G38_2140515 [Gigaspora rosea]